MVSPIPQPSRRRFVPIYTPHNEQYFAKHHGELIGKREMMLHEKHVVTAALSVEKGDINVLAMTGGAGWFEEGMQDYKDNLFDIAFTSVWYINDDDQIMEIPILQESVVKEPRGPDDTRYTIDTAEAGGISFAVSRTAGLVTPKPLIRCKIITYSVEIQRYAFAASWTG